ncbi:MAG: flagellar export protein FliJ [Lachnospiraceae bacterium]|nr:flagellar export protein FliJ [Lachnospiraceae bacterium]
MARFRYRMQNILNIKSKLEEQEKNNFAAAQRKLLEEQERLEIIMKQRDALEEEAKEMRSSTLNVLQLQENEYARKYVAEQMKKQRLNVLVAEKNVEAARGKMQKAIQERKIHDKLKEHAFEEFLQEENAAEMKEIDQLTSYTHGKKETDSVSGE